MYHDYYYLSEEPTDLVGRWTEQGPGLSRITTHDGATWTFLTPGPRAIEHYRSGRYSIGTDGQYGIEGARRLTEAEAVATIAAWGYGS